MSREADTGQGAQRPFLAPYGLLQSSRTPYEDEIIVDLFAGGGGASTGIEMALGRYVDIAINHDPEAVALHQANHRMTTHYVSDVFEVDPATACAGFDIGLLWASPDCKHFSKAKGGKPVSKKIRGLAWVVVKWAKVMRPRVIALENVEEFQTWGPLGADDRPCPERKGRTFQRWVRSLKQLGYAVEWREMRACDYGAPTIRKRLFVVARCDNQPIVFPDATHGAPESLAVQAGKLQPWRTAAECIDWSIPCPSIFERKRPLAEATLRRIAKGVMRYVVEAQEPFIVGLAHGEHKERPGTRSTSTRAPVRTIHSQGGNFAVVDATIAPFVTEHANASNQRNMPADEPLRTQLAQVKGGHFALVSAFLAKHYSGHTTPGWPLQKPISTITAQDHHALVTSNLIKLRGTSRDGQPVTEPLHTISAQGQHFGEVRAFLIKYYGSDQDPRLEEPMHTVTSKHRFGLVYVHGEPYAIVDIGMRMLTPRELYRAQGFPESYIIDKGGDGRALTKTAQVRMCGNSVCPPVGAAIVRANYTPQGAGMRIAA
jgi:DNA (cytosine-5)-methyltransferase 1